MSKLTKWTPLFFTQFLGVLNDNVLKNAIIFIGIFWLAKDEQPLVIPIASALLVLPFLLFSPLAGKWAQTFSKRKIFEIAKLLEIPIMIIASAGFFMQSIYVVMLAMLLMGLQSALYSPSKYGLIRDIGGVEGVSFGIGTMELLTFVGVLLGQVGAGIISDLPEQSVLVVSVLMVALAILGWLSSKKIHVEEPPTMKINDSVNPIKYIYQSYTWSKKIKGLNYTIFGLGGFWLVASMLQMNIYLHAPNHYGMTNTETSIVMALIAIGIGLGCWVAGMLSANRVEIGMVPIGGIGLSICLTLFSLVDLDTTSFVILLVVAAFFSGFYKVPLNAWLQERVEGRKIGNILAYNNMVAFAFILIAAGLFGFFSSTFDTGVVFTVIAVVSWIMTIITLLNIPAMMVRFIANGISKFYYNYEVSGIEHIPKKTGALLVANHISLLDPLMVVAVVPRMVRFVMARQLYEHPSINWLVRRLNVIPVSSKSDKAKLDNFNEICQREINAGHIVCIFPEGQISRIGHLLEFKKGIEHIAKGIEAPIIPLQMEGVKGTPFSFETGESSPVKKLTSFRKRIQIAIGQPIKTKVSAYLVRQQMQELNAETFEKRISSDHTLNYFFSKKVKTWGNNQILTDRSDPYTYKAISGEANRLVAYLKNNVHDSIVGVYIPNSKNGLVTNLAIALAGKVSVNIPDNPTTAELNTISEKQQFSLLLTSHKCKLDDPHFDQFNSVFVEDLLASSDNSERSSTPLSEPLDKEQLVSVIYERDEHGLAEIPLTHQNVLATIKGLMQTHTLGINDKMLNIIPIHTTYGYIFNVWLPVLLGINIVFVEDSSSSTLARRIIDHQVNVLLANRTIVQDLFARQDDEIWRNLQYILTGIDRVSDDIKAQLVTTHGLHVSESLSFTELGTLISVNTPHYNLVDISGKEITQPGSNGFSYGRCIPGLAVKTVNPQNFDDTLDEGEEGVLLVKGAAISRFTGQPDEIFHKGWYITKRICSINSHGFIELIDDKTEQNGSKAG